MLPLELHCRMPISEQLYSQFRVVEKLHQDVILAFDWLHSANP